MKFRRLVCLILICLLILPVLPSCDSDSENTTDTTISDTASSDTEASDTSEPDTDAAETSAPGTEAAESSAPDTEAAESSAPDTEAGETSAPDTTAAPVTAPVTTPATTPATTPDTTPATTPATAPSTTVPETTEPAITTEHVFEEISVDFGDIPEIPMEEGVKNYLLIGTDALTDTANGRSDCMIIVTVNPAKKRIALTSIMRDTYVNISDAKTSNKINAAHSYGGAATLMKTIEENFGIHIDHYARAKYADFVKVCEYLGGFDLTLDKSEINYINDGLKNDPYINTIYKNCKKEGFSLTVTSSIPTSSAGKEIHLNADALFIYARARKLSGGDYKRTERQRNIVTLAFNKVKDLNAGQLAALLDKCLPFITTDLTRTDCLSLIWNAPTYAKYDFVSTRLPMDGYFIDTYEPSGHKTSWLEIKSAKKGEMMEKWAEIVNN